MTVVSNEKSGGPVCRLKITLQNGKTDFLYVSGNAKEVLEDFQKGGVAFYVRVKFHYGRKTATRPSQNEKLAINWSHVAFIETKNFWGKYE